MTNKYNIILADPPWTFEKGSKKSGKKWWGTAGQHYRLMTTSEICELNSDGDIEDLSTENAALFLWVPWAMLQDGLDVINEWGFRYRTLAWVWMKTKLSPHSVAMVASDEKQLKMGFGYYTRSVSEPCLLAIRGSMPVTDHSIRAAIFAPIKEHSAKPNEQYDKIQLLYPDTRKLEMFARNAQPDWEVWGDESPKEFRSVEAYRRLSERMEKYRA